MNSEDPYSFQSLTGTEQASPLPNSKRVMGELAEYFRKLTHSISEEIKSESKSIAAAQLSLTTTKLDNLAEALREAAGELREKHSYSLANIMEFGSESVMRISNHFRVTGPEALIDEMADFARNQPGIFLGSAVFTGILLGQLFSSAGKRGGTVQEYHPRKESSIEYKPGSDEGGYHVPH